ncbi:MAG: superoxide dismutase family protein [Candidatus Omnitrophica bacterium]|nr:superoxide dismutase family protein [Candidatus Omnitrophota bacterium]
MNKTFIPLFILIIFCLAKPSFREEAIAVIQGTEENSTLVGAVLFEDTDEGLKIEADISEAPPGTHGIHIHETGSCEDKGNAAGGHYNPEGVKHGFLLTEGFEGAHAGDLGNIQISEEGTGNLYLVVPGLTIKDGTHNVEGRAVILHEKQDDFGQPTGNAGGRIGCGVIKIREKIPPFAKKPA